MVSFIAYLHHEADQVDPRLWYILIALLVGGLLYAWRKLHFASFGKLPATIQGLSGALVGAVVDALSENLDAIGTKQAVFKVFMGVISGFAAAGGHHWLKNMTWVPYQGGHPSVREMTPEEKAESQTRDTMSTDTPPPPPSNAH